MSSESGERYSGIGCLMIVGVVITGAAYGSLTTAAHGWLAIGGGLVAVGLVAALIGYLEGRE